MIVISTGLGSCQGDKGEQEMSDNPFFNEYTTPFGVPPFDLVENEHYMPAFEEGMIRQRAEVDKIISSKKKPTFDNTIRALDETGDLLNKVSYVFFGLSSANTDEEMQKIQLEISPKL